MASNLNNSYSLLNNIANLLLTYNLIHSDQVKMLFIEMSKDDFDIDFSEMSKENAEMLNNILKISDSLLSLYKTQPEAKMLFPKEIFEGVASMNQKIKPFEEYIVGLANGTMTNAQIEHKLLSWGCDKLNEDYLLEFSESL